MKISGLPDVRAMLQELPLKIEKKAATDAMVDSAERMAEAARQNAGKSRRTGKLQDAIGVYRKTAKSQRKTKVSVNKDVGEAYVGVGYRRGSQGYAPHAHLVEFGTGPRFQKTTGRYVGQMPAKPFMRPAFDAEKVGYIRLFSVALLARLNKALAKYRAKGRRK